MFCCQLKLQPSRGSTADRGPDNTFKWRCYHLLTRGAATAILGTAAASLRRKADEQNVKILRLWIRHLSPLVCYSDFSNLSKKAKSLELLNVYAEGPPRRNTQQGAVAGWHCGGAPDPAERLCDVGVNCVGSMQKRLQGRISVSGARGMARHPTRGLCQLELTRRNNIFGAAGLRVLNSRILCSAEL